MDRGDSSGLENNDRGREQKESKRGEWDEAKEMHHRKREDILSIRVRRKISDVGSAALHNLITIFYRSTNIFRFAPHVLVSFY
ncbi:hypothetical protein AB3S75_030132 [Citrus x aurantiifolia]